VIDPRRIDLVRSPHIEAADHLQLRPGTNVAVINALAHVIVTEGLVDEAFVAERCDMQVIRALARFVADDRQLARSTESITGVPAAEPARRGAALRQRWQQRHLLRPGRHRAQPGLDDGDGHRQPRDGHRQLGRAGVGVNPLRGQNNVQGSCDMGSFPHELPGYRHVSDADTRRLFEAPGA
jgi:formate dehydrogenase major subunit